MCMSHIYFHFFFFNDTATTEIYTLSLHDALPIYDEHQESDQGQVRAQIVRLQQVDRELARLRADDASHQAAGEHERDRLRLEIGACDVRCREPVVLRHGVVHAKHHRAETKKPEIT